MFFFFLAQKSVFLHSSGVSHLPEDADGQVSKFSFVLAVSVRSVEMACQVGLGQRGPV